MRCPRRRDGLRQRLHECATTALLWACRVRAQANGGADRRDRGSWQGLCAVGSAEQGSTGAYYGNVHDLIVHQSRYFGRARN